MGARLSLRLRLRLWVWPAPLALALALGLCAAALGTGCGAPVVYPRTASVGRAGDFSMRWSGNISHTPVSADVQTVGASPPGVTRPPDQVIEPAEDDEVLRLFGQVYTLPGNGQVLPAFALADGFELGALVSFARVGFELRGALLEQEAGAPVSLALSAAGSTHGLVGARGLGFRAGLDASIDDGARIWLLGVYGGASPYRYTFGPSDAVWHLRALDSAAIGVERDEIRLSVPLGVALPSPSDGNGGGSALLLGVVPEWTLDSAVTRSECGSPCSGGRELTRFTQSFALFITLGLELGTTPDHGKRRMAPWD